MVVNRFMKQLMYNNIKIRDVETHSPYLILHLFRFNINIDVYLGSLHIMYSFNFVQCTLIIIVNLSFCFVFFITQMISFILTNRTDI